MASPLKIEGEGLASILESRSMTREEAEEAIGEEEAMAGEEAKATTEEKAEATMGEEKMAAEEA